MLSETEVSDVQDQNYYYLLALLTSLPFHHLISAQEMYSSISAEVKQSNKQVIIPSIYDSPHERLKLFQNAALSAKRLVKQTKNRQTEHQSKEFPILLDRFIQHEFTDTAPSGKKFEVDWQVIFNDELQGCAEIYRAEMLIFKRMLYEKKEELKSVLTLLNDRFSEHLNYELFDLLKGNKMEKLLINSLSAKYQISVTTHNKKSNKIISADKESKRVTNQKGKFEIALNLTENLSILTGRLHGWESYPINDLIIYELRTGAYWAKWRQAARLSKFDFDLLESLDARSIRLYELTKFLRLSSFDKTTLILPSDLTIHYEKLMLLMPLQKLKTEKEIKIQLEELFSPLIKINYLKSFSYSRCTLKNTNPHIIFEFQIQNSPLR